MEEGSHVWFRSPKSEWGWLPAKITRRETVPKPRQARGAYGRPHPQSPRPVGASPGQNGDDKLKSPLIKSLEDGRRKELQGIMRDRSLSKEARKQRMDEAKERHSRLVEEAEAKAAAEIGKEKEEEKKGESEAAPEDTVVQLTLVDDFTGLESPGPSVGGGRGRSYYAGMESFMELVLIDAVAAREEHPDIKLRNMPSSDAASSVQFYGESNVVNRAASSAPPRAPAEGGAVEGAAPDAVAGGVDDLIGLTHLHEPAILHALRLRYDADIIYTSTGPILLAINPFKVSAPSPSPNIVLIDRETGSFADAGRVLWMDTAVLGLAGIRRTFWGTSFVRNSLLRRSAWQYKTGAIVVCASIGDGHVHFPSIFDSLPSCPCKKRLVVKEGWTATIFHLAFQAVNIKWNCATLDLGHRICNVCS